MTSLPQLITPIEQYAISWLVPFRTCWKYPVGSSLGRYVLFLAPEETLAEPDGDRSSRPQFLLLAHLRRCRRQLESGQVRPPRLVDARLGSCAGRNPVFASWPRELTCSAVFAWYLLHRLPVTPVNPGSAHVTVQGKAHAAIASLSSLSRPTETSLSIVTPPAVTLGLLKEARRLGIPSVWMQPGSFDDDALELALASGAFRSVVYGDGGAHGQGWCVLADGETALSAARKL